MLMDEPFGALDPISRDRLQNEFLRLQQEIGKTIVFVTHDIDEAIKMGDRIAILREGSAVAQYDTPETVLAAPADDFVREFIGSGAVLKRLGLVRIGDVDLGQWPTAAVGGGREAARRAAASSDRGSVLLLDDRRRPLRWVRADELADSGDSLERSGIEVRAVVEPTATLAAALESLLGSGIGAVSVVDGDGALLGTLDLGTIMAAVETIRTATPDTLPADRPAADEMAAR
jgi:osmoprotectant transport system ATP-binding protein